MGRSVRSEEWLRCWCVPPAWPPVAMVGPYPVMTRAQMRAGLDLLPTWALEQNAAANRRVTAVMRERLAAGEQVARCTRSRG